MTKECSGASVRYNLSEAYYTKSTLAQGGGYPVPYYMQHQMNQQVLSLNIAENRSYQTTRGK